MNEPGEPGAACERCGRRPLATRYLMRAASGTICSCLGCALRHPPLVRRAALTALVVGTVLFLINQLDVVLTLGLAPRVALKVALTYCVPYCVTTWGALLNARRAPG